MQNRLKPFLPAVENLPDSDDEIRETIQAPQFKQVFIYNVEIEMLDITCGGVFFSIVFTYPQKHSTPDVYQLGSVEI